MNEPFSSQKHWESIYSEKALSEVSWYQTKPKASWELMQYLNVSKEASIIDVGGGDSLFVDFLIDNGFKNITVMDISEKAILRAKDRLKEKSAFVKWIVSDVTEFSPPEKYDLWHDRAVLHFLTSKDLVNKYLENVKKSVKPNAKIIVGTFSENGPDKCSGLEIKKYSENSMSDLFMKYFRKIKCVLEDHITPFKTIQNFIFCSFQNA